MHPRNFQGRKQRRRERAQTGQPAYAAKDIRFRVGAAGRAGVRQGVV